MPKYAAVNIPSPLDSLGRVHRLRDLGRQAKREDQADLAAQQEQAENAEIMRILREAGATPEDFETKALPAIHQINPVKALGLLEQHRKVTAKPDPGPLETVTGPDGKPTLVSRLNAVGKTPYTAPVAPEPLVQVDEGGLPVYRARGDAIGKPAYRAPTTDRTVTPFEAAIAAFKREKNREPNADEIVSIESQLAGARRRPEQDAGERVAIITARARAEEEKADAYRRLEDQYRDSQTPKFDRVGRQIGKPMTRAQLDAAKAEIEKGYRAKLRQLGLVEPDGTRLADVARPFSGPQATASRNAVLPPSMRTGAPPVQAPPAPPVVAAVPPPPVAGSGGVTGAPVSQGVRGEAQAVLMQFNAEKDPAKKAQLAQRLRQLRDQLTR